MALLRIRNKLDGEIVEIASLPGAKGEDGKDGKDGKNGTDGYTPVKGVDYFTPAEQEAFIGAAKDYVDEKIVSATCETYGVVRVADDADMASITGGIYPDKSCYDRLSIVPAKEDQIDGRYGCGTVITPLNLEYAVKSVGDGYYALAENLPKEKPYEKIADVVVTADADGALPSHIIFSADSNGEPFELGSFYVKALIGATDGSSARLALSVNDRIVFGNTNLGAMISTTPQGWAMYYKDLGENEGVFCLAQNLAFGSAYPSAPNVNSATVMGGVILPYMTSHKPVKKVDFWCQVGTKMTFVAGTKMELWGVRK